MASLNFLKFLIGCALDKVVTKMDFYLLRFYKGREAADLIKRIKPYVLKPSELLTLYSLAKEQTNIDGDFAEVGVFKGVSAEIICKAKNDKPFHLFDTFESFPEISKYDNAISSIERKYFTADFEKIKEKFSKYENVRIYKGLFPQTSGPIKDKKFSLVHLDADLYQSTKDSLEFFYPRMTSGGIIVLHDYYAGGVKKAINEFLKDKKESVIQLPMSQCALIKK